MLKLNFKQQQLSMLNCKRLLLPLNFKQLTDTIACFILEPYWLNLLKQITNGKACIQKIICFDLSGKINDAIVQCSR